jgi:hypothetical protein
MINTQEYLNKCNEYLSSTLGVKKINIELQISTRSKSDYGWCRSLSPGNCKISFSEFIIGTPSEEHIIEHELVHAYVEEYWPEGVAHGHNFKEISNKLFDHDKMKKPWVKREEALEMDINFNTRIFTILFDGEEKAIIDLSNGDKITDPQGKKFKHENTATLYNNIFFMMIKTYEKLGFDFKGEFIKSLAS